MRAIFGSYLWVKVSIKARPYTRAFLTPVSLNQQAQAFVIMT